MSRRALLEARRYFVAAAVLELLSLPLRPLRGRLLLGLGAVVLFFFRDPDRELTADPDTIYAPADGRVTAVETVEDDWLPGAEALSISTFLSLTDVHVNRAPAPGRIVEATESGGGYAPAFMTRAAENHRKRLAIEDGRRRLVLVQYSGLVARRISSWSWLGDRVEAGQRIALIHLGSRADVLVPAAAARPLVEVGQKVRAGVTPIATYLPERRAA